MIPKFASEGDAGVCELRNRDTSRWAQLYTASRLRHEIRIVADREPGMSATTATSIFVTAQDGLRLHVRSYGPRTATALPMVCLPGLARTGADFETLQLGWRTIRTDRGA